MTTPTKEELLFGRIAVHNKLLSQEQYDECLAIRSRQSDPKNDFGRVVKAKGFLDEKQYRQIRKAQEKHLVQKMALSEDQAQRAARGLDPNAAGPVPSDDEGDAAQEFTPEDAEEEAAAPAAPAAPAASAPEIKLAAPPRVESAPAEVKPLDPAIPHTPRPADEASRQLMVNLLKKAREYGASDLHLSCGAKPFLRLHGAIKPFETMPLLTDESCQKLLSSITNDQQWSLFFHKNDWDGSIDLGPLGRFRTNLLRQRRGCSGVFRVIKDKVPILADLGLPDTLERFTTYHQGLVLVTGAAGSGKSSTLAAMVEVINLNRKDHIIALEDPIEFVYESKNCNVTQRQVDLHTKSWGNALRAALRENPDVIMIGEMRDLDTVRLAITASETGHLVFGTLHTTNATRTIDRLLDVFPAKEQSQIRAMVSESLKGIVSQQLVPRADGKGRVVAYELLFTTPAVSHLIRERRTFQLFSVMQTGKKLGMRLMDDSLKELVTQGLITKEEARVRATNPKIFG